MSKPTDNPGATLRKLQFEYQAVSLRRSGKSVQEIAEMLDIEPQKVKLAIKRGLKVGREQLAELASEVKQLDLMRLDEIFSIAHTKYLATGCVKAGKLMLEVVDRRSKLLGNDAPTKVAGVVAGITPGAGPAFSYTALSVEETEALALIVAKGTAQADLDALDQDDLEDDGADYPEAAYAAASILHGVINAAKSSGTSSGPSG